MPIFKSTPARMTEMGVGASTCASGSQVWKGNIGILMAKPMKSATQATRTKVIPRTSGALMYPPARAQCVIFTMLKVWTCTPFSTSVGPLKYRPMIASSISTEPVSV